MAKMQACIMCPPHRMPLCRGGRKGAFSWECRGRSHLFSTPYALVQEMQQGRSAGGVQWRGSAGTATA